MSKHLVVISCENRAYHGWQAMVATYSCLKRQRVTPLIVVSGAADEEIHPDFLECERAGAWVMRSKNYRGHGLHEWAARNTAGALLDAYHVGKLVEATHLVVMDPDMVWTRKITWPSRFAVDKCCLESLEDAPTVEVCEAFGVKLPPNASCKIGARVPYVVPMEIAEAIGEAWWEALDLYAPRPDRGWADQMLAWVLACLKVGEQPVRLSFSQTDWDYRAEANAPLVHYAYGSPYFNKRSFASEESAGMVWKDQPTLPLRSAQGWVLREIANARRFFDALKEQACV